MCFNIRISRSCQATQHQRCPWATPHPNRFDHGQDETCPGREVSAYPLMPCFGPMISNYLLTFTFFCSKCCFNLVFVPWTLLMPYNEFFFRQAASDFYNERWSETIWTTMASFAVECNWKNNATTTIALKCRVGVLDWQDMIGSRPLVYMADDFQPYAGAIGCLSPENGHLKAEGKVVLAMDWHGEGSRFLLEARQGRLR